MNINWLRTNIKHIWTFKAVQSELYTPRISVGFRQDGDLDQSGAGGESPAITIHHHGMKTWSEWFWKCNYVFTVFHLRMLSPVIFERWIYRMFDCTRPQPQACPFSSGAHEPPPLWRHLHVNSHWKQSKEFKSRCLYGCQLAGLRFNNTSTIIAAKLFGYPVQIPQLHWGLLLSRRSLRRSASAHIMKLLSWQLGTPLAPPPSIHSLWIVVGMLEHLPTKHFRSKQPAPKLCTTQLHIPNVLSSVLSQLRHHLFHHEMWKVCSLVAKVTSSLHWCLFKQVNCQF